MCPTIRKPTRQITSSRVRLVALEFPSAQYVNLRDGEQTAGKTLHEKTDGQFLELFWEQKIKHVDLDTSRF